MNEKIKLIFFKSKTTEFGFFNKKRSFEHNDYLFYQIV